MPFRRFIVAMFAAASVVACGSSSSAQPADFYAGKQIVLLVGGNAGGGYDLYARALSRHMGRHVSGAPTFVVRNQPGAGSGTAAAFLSSIAPKDGTIIGALFPGVIIGPLLEEKSEGLFDPTKFAYLGSADSGTRVCITYRNSPIKSFEDARKSKAIMGASAAGGSTRDYAYMNNHAAGAKFEVVSGYKGTVDIFLAMERGEVDGMCGLDWTSLKSQRPDWLRDGKLNIILQNGADSEPELEKIGVPTVWSFIGRQEDRAAVEMVVSQQIFGRPFVMPPGTPPERVKILRDAFMATLKDPKFLEDAEKTRLDVAPSAGERVQQVVEKLYSSSGDTVRRARQIISPEG